MSDWSGNDAEATSSSFENDVVNAVRSFTYLSCQSSAENSAGTNLEANLLYNSASEVQGNFSLFYGLAQRQLSKDEVRLGITFSDADKLAAYAYLIQHFQEKKFKDWDANEINLSNDLVKKNIQQTSGWASYQHLLIQVSKAIQMDELDLDVHTDSTNYPDEWNDTQIDIDEIDFED